MDNTIVLKQESKVMRILKDEKGMTLIELLATVVILAIIAAIGVTAIGRVIQNTREDAAIANVQQAMNGAKLYQGTEGDKKGDSFSLKEVIDGGYLEVAKTVWTDTESVKFNVQSDGSLSVILPEKALTAGSKSSAPLTLTAESVLDLKRATLFLASSGESGED